MELLADSALIDNTWNHIAAVYDGSKMHLIINGRLSGQKDFNSAVSTSNSNLYIGADPTEGSGLFLPCKIDEVRIWNHARKLDQITATMYDTLNGAYYQSSDSGLVAYYRLDKLEDLGINADGADDVRDLSIYANHGDTHGGPFCILSDAPVRIINTDHLVTSNFWLEQNYPNPFNPRTVISWHLAVSSQVNLSVYDLHGKKVATLINEQQPAGTHRIEWDVSDNTHLASGVYLYKLSTDNGYTSSKKLLLLK